MAKLNIDGSSVVDTTTDYTGGLAEENRVHFAPVSNFADAWVDDIGVDDAAFPGAGSIVTLIPNATGDAAGWTRGGTDSGANWSQCEEVPPNDDTDYVVANEDSPQQIDQYNCGDFSPAISSITGVWTVIRVRGEGTTARTISYGHRLSSTNYTDSENAAYTSYATVLGTFRTVDPSGGAWSDADLDALQTDLQYTQAQARNVRVSVIYNMVEYVPAVGGGQTYNETPTQSFLLDPSVAALGVFPAVSIHTLSLSVDALASAALSESPSQVWVLVPSSLETRLFTELPAQSWAFAVDRQDLAAFLDNPGVSGVFAPVSGDAASLVDTPPVVVTLPVSILARAAFAEGQIAISPLLLLPGVDEFRAFSEVTVGTLILLPTVRDQVVAQDTPVLAATLLPSVLDYRALGETGTASVVLALSVADLAQFVEQPATSFVLIPSAVDLISLGESVGVSFVLLPTVTEGLQFSEMPSQAWVLSPAIRDQFAATDFPSQVTTFFPFSGDIAALGDVPSVAAVLPVSVLARLVAVESPVQLWQFAVDRQDAAILGEVPPASVVFVTASQDILEAVETGLLTVAVPVTLLDRFVGVDAPPFTLVLFPSVPSGNVFSEIPLMVFRLRPVKTLAAGAIVG